MGRIVYTITSGDLPMTVNLKQDGSIIDTNIHAVYGTYSFEDVDKGTETYLTLTVEFIDSMDCYTSEIITLCVNCPDGYDQVGDKCIHYEEVEPVYTEPVYTIVKKEDDPAYAVYGAIVFDDGWNYNGTGVYERILPLTNTYWANSPYPSFTGVMNRTAVWASETKGDQDIGFSFCIDIAVAKTYYIGFACDNWGKIKINGTFILEQDRDDIMTMFNTTDSGILHKYWFIYPVEVEAGRNIIEVYGHNESWIAGVGIQIYNATKKDLFDVTNENPLGSKILFSSEELVDSVLNYEYTPTEGYHGYNCPDGYSLDDCDGSPKCIQRIEINCGDEPPVTTTTTTAAPTTTTTTTAEPTTTTTTIEQEVFSYDGNSSTTTSVTACNSFAGSSSVQYLRKIWKNYTGPDFDTIEILSLNPNVDGDVYATFTFRNYVTDQEITNYPFQLSINGLSYNNSYLPDALIHFNNYINGNYVLCVTGAQTCSFDFRIKNVDGMWGPVRTAIFIIESS
jgi:hypothetical protein